MYFVVGAVQRQTAPDKLPFKNNLILSNEKNLSLPSWELWLIGLGIVACGLFAVQSVREGEPISMNEIKLANAQTETRVRQELENAQRESERMVAAGSLREAKRDAVVTFLKQIGARRRYNEVSVMMDLVAWARNASEEDLLTALTFGRSVLRDKEFGGALEMLVFARLGEVDPEVGQSLFYALPGGMRPSGDALKAFFSAWAQKDPFAAVDGALAQLHHDPTDIGEAIKKMFESIMDENPALAGDFAAELAQSDDKSERDLGRSLRVKMMSAQLNATRDFQATVRWIENTKVSNDERQHLLSALVQEGLGGEDLNGAVYAYRLLGAERHVDLAGRMAVAMAATQPEQAKELVLSLPTGQERAKAIRELVDKLSEKDGAGAALDWLSALNSDRDFDETYESLAKGFIEANPENAFRSVSAMTNSDRKDKLTSAYGFLWLQRDYANAATKLTPDFVAQYEKITALAAQIRQVSPNYHGTLQF